MGIFDQTPLAEVLVRHTNIDPSLFNFLLTQSSIHQEMPFDTIEKVIKNCIDCVKAENLNARIANAALNFNGTLVLAQIYVERKNGYAATEKQQFGTSPTSYNVQVRFPFAMTCRLGSNTVYLPSGDFHKALLPYKTSVKVVDDVRRDYSINDIVLGPGVNIRYGTQPGYVEFFLGDDQKPAIVYHSETSIGLGYTIVPQTEPEQREYFELDDYLQQYKITGCFPLFYYSQSEPHQGLLRFFPEYPGYTRHQDNRCERRDYDFDERKRAYCRYIQDNNQLLKEYSGGRALEENLAVTKDLAPFVLDITYTNGIGLFTHSGQPLTRVRDYQMELMAQCAQFLRPVLEKPSFQSTKAGMISMGVGSGKTFIVFALLMWMRHVKKNVNPLQFAPPFCLAPDEAVATVTQKAINRQGQLSSCTAFSVVGAAQLPNQNFINYYAQITRHAVEEAQRVENFLTSGLQQEVLNFCNEYDLHPLKIINLMSNIRNNCSERLKNFKESIDLKRLLLMIEGQKTLVQQTGMLSLTAVQNLLEQFETIEKNVGEMRDILPFSEASSSNDAKSSTLEINYDQYVDLPLSMGTGKLNVRHMTPQKLGQLLNSGRFKGNLRQQRDFLIRVICLQDPTAAVILANSGGLGNTYTDEELRRQIAKFSALAAEEIQKITAKKTQSWHGHYRVYLCLNEIFSTIPDEINFNRFSGQSLRAPALYTESIQHNILLISHMKKCIQDFLDTLKTVRSVMGAAVDVDLTQYGIDGNTNVIHASHHLASIAALRITGHAEADHAQLLVTHTPVFTPEGLACYVEHLANLEGKLSVTFQKRYGIYEINFQSVKVNKRNIALRLTQLFTAVVIADEAHKEEYQFLYDTSDPIHSRINLVTTKYLKKTFLSVLPPRIGMSGTINSIAQRAFSGSVLYDFSTQRMIQQGLVKHLNFDVFGIMPFKSPENPVQETAMKLVADYFLQNQDLSFLRFKRKKRADIDLFTLSKGLFFMKSLDPRLKKQVLWLFNLLINENPDQNEKRVQDELLQKINDERQARNQFLLRKLHGAEKLSAAEQRVIPIVFGSSEKVFTVNGGIIQNQFDLEWDEKRLTIQDIRLIHRHAFINNIIALYLEYLLSKSSSPKEFSDIIGFQNQLFENGYSLLELHEIPQDDRLQIVLEIKLLIQGIDPKTITRQEIEHFFKDRIKNDKMTEMLLLVILDNKNNLEEGLRDLIRKCQDYPLSALITDNRNEFESGTALLMWGSERERTGYSHEPVGIIIDASIYASSANAMDLNQLLGQIDSRRFDKQSCPALYPTLQSVLDNTFSFDEKNQVGGRALRTPHGQVRYVEYLSGLSHCASFNRCGGLMLETRFEDIFTVNEKQVKEYRASITFNREAWQVLRKDFRDLQSYANTLAGSFKHELENSELRLMYETWIADRLPLLWMIKMEPGKAATMLIDKDFSDLLTVDPSKLLLTQPQEVGTKSTLFQAPGRNINGDMENPLDGNFELINQYFTPVENKLNELIEKGTPTSAQFSIDYLQAGVAAKNLKITLTQAIQSYRQDPETLDNFRRECSDAINKSRSEQILSTHRGWHQLHPLLRAFLGCLAIITVVPALVVASKRNLISTFFKTPSTDTWSKLESFESSITLVLGF